MQKDIGIHELKDRDVIERFLREDPYLHLYGLGDLDDFFWPKTRWLSFQSGSNILSIILLYEDIQTPVLLALNHRSKLPAGIEKMNIGYFLPDTLNAHLTSDFRMVLEQDFSVYASAFHHKMALKKLDKVESYSVDDVIRLGMNDREELLKLYSLAYPHNWFNERMLQTGWYFGIRRDERLVSVAGIHVFSEKYRVAALGNITTHPDYRSQGLAGKVTAALCREIAGYADHIGLNVHSENTSAIHCYEMLGFQITGGFEECRLVKRKQV